MGWGFRALKESSHKVRYVNMIPTTIHPVSLLRFVLFKVTNDPPMTPYLRR